MYFKYHFNANITAAQLAADLVAIITGTTNPNSLGAGCNKEFSELVANTKATNWTMFDNNSPNAPVVKSLNADGTSYKYVKIDVTITEVNLIGYESWNAATHVGANLAYGGGYASSSFSAITNPTVGVSGSLGILVTDKFITIVRNVANGTNFGGVYEFDRQSSSLNNTYPCTVSIGSSADFNTTGNSNTTYMGICRIKNPAAAGDLISVNIVGNVHQIINPDGYGNIEFSQTTGALGIDNALHLTTFPIILGYSAKSGHFTMLGTVLGDILTIPNTTIVFSNLDETVINSKTYMMIRANRDDQTVLLIPKE